MGLFRRLWDLYGLCVTCHIQYGWDKAIDNESFYENQEGIYLMVDSVDNKSNENPV